MREADKGLDLAREVGGQGLDKAREASGQGLDALKSKLGLGGGEAPSAGAGPK
jgi:hypothetical protein